MKFFENLPVRGKIFGTFGIALVIAFVIGIFGTLGINRLGTEISDMYHNDTEPIGSISHVIQNVMTLSSSFDMAILAAMSDDYDSVKEYEKSVNELYAETDLLLDEVNDKIFRDEVQTLFDSATKKYYDTLVPTGPTMFEKLNAGHIEEAEEIMEAADVAIGEMTDEFKRCLDTKIERAYDTFELNSATVRNLNILLIVVLCGGSLAVFGLAILLSISITRPMLSMMRFARETAETGNLQLSTVEIDRVAERRDEIGRTVQAFCQMTDMFREQARILRTVSHGDLTPDVVLKSQTDTVGTSLSIMLDEIGSMLRDVSAASKQVAMGIGQIAAGSSDLSNSINEQNNSIESISSALHNIGEKVNANLTDSNSAKDLAYRINEEAKNGDKKMMEMVSAVYKINEASGGIGNIMKSIDDIAFQTNILALNAAVEAARAGQHGKGFAVVADEVRNLAAKSAEAASESNTLISNSLQLTESGVEIAETTRKTIETITSGIQEISAFIEKMSQAAQEQAQAMEQLSQGIGEISEVIHRTSANAEESSAACEEINALSNSLDELVANFKVKPVR